jgi:hypothetical protein
MRFVTHFWLVNRTDIAHSDLQFYVAGARH